MSNKTRTLQNVSYNMHMSYANERRTGHDTMKKHKTKHRQPAVMMSQMLLLCLTVTALENFNNITIWITLNAIS